MRRPLSALAFAATFVIVAPAGAQEAAPAEAQAPAQDEKKAKKPRASRNLITRELVEKAVAEGATSAYDVVQKLRRDWFRVRTELSVAGAASGDAPKRPSIFMDMQTLGDDPELLRNIKPELVKEIRFLSGPDATTLFGTGYPLGVIQVITQLSGQ
ncbi:MAG TPA: hypothetical protein VJ672_14405 [Gemmatimonadaceae bacterium]|nr:hypothetical protein [Gemmatimonadaceae bacterium]